jgi:hypothetical protein
MRTQLFTLLYCLILLYSVASDMPKALAASRLPATVVPWYASASTIEFRSDFFTVPDRVLVWGKGRLRSLPMIGRSSGPISSPSQVVAANPGFDQFPMFPVRNCVRAPPRRDRHRFLALASVSPGKSPSAARR